MRASLLLILLGGPAFCDPPAFDDSGLAPAGLEALCALPAYGTFNVKTGYGAVGDGLTDDTVAIRAAIAAAASAGSGLIYFPTGTYAVAPQGGDSNAGFYKWIFHLTASNLVFIGDGPASQLIGYMPGLASPLTNWVTTGDSYFKIQRFGMFFADSAGGALDTIQFRSMKIDGQAGYTGDFTVGGSTVTGDGWDLTHKALEFNGPSAITNVLVFNCTLSHWRGELIHGPNVGLSVVRSHAYGSNASALSTSGNVLVANSIIGGPTDDERIYNGVENFAFPGDAQVFQDSTIQRAAANGIAFISYPTGTLTVARNLIDQNHYGILFSEAGHNILISNNTFTNNANGMITSVLNLYPELVGNTGFDHLTITNNMFDNSGTAFLDQGNTIPSFTFQGNTITNGTVLGGTFGATLGSWVGFAIDNNRIGTGASDMAGSTAARTNYALWTRTGRAVGSSTVGSACKVDQFSTSDVETTIYPKTDRTWLNANLTSGAHHYAIIDPATLPAYPVGFTTFFVRGVNAWTLKADPAWNTFAADVTVGADGIAIRKNAAGVFELIEPRVTGVLIR